MNYPPTEYLELDCFDVCAFNVYLHREADLRAYLARLQQIAGRAAAACGGGRRQHPRGDNGQAAITAMHIRAAFEEGLCGAVAFSWTDEWWRGGTTSTTGPSASSIAIGSPKPALAAVARRLPAPFPGEHA